MCQTSVAKLCMYHKIFYMRLVNLSVGSRMKKKLYARPSPLSPLFRHFRSITKLRHNFIGQCISSHPKNTLYDRNIIIYLLFITGIHNLTEKFRSIFYFVSSSHFVRLHFLKRFSDVCCALCFAIFYPVSMLRSLKFAIV